MVKPVTVIIDTRERHPFEFGQFDVEVVRAKLETGDYSVRTLEHTVCVERKSSPLEVASNLFCEYDRFRRLLGRMDQFQLAAICCTFSYELLATFPEGSSKHDAAIAAKIRVDGGRIVKRLTRLQGEHPNIQWSFAQPNEARDRTLRFLLAAWERYGHTAAESANHPIPTPRSNATA